MLNLKLCTSLTLIVIDSTKSLSAFVKTKAAGPFTRIVRVFLAVILLSMKACL